MGINEWMEAERPDVDVPVQATGGVRAVAVPFIHLTGVVEYVYI